MDSELNVAHEWFSVSEKMRRQLWDLHTSSKGSHDDPVQAYKAWEEIIEENNQCRAEGRSPVCSLVEFNYDAPVMSDLD